MAGDDGAANDNDISEGPKKFRFPSHQAHMVSLAKMCQENKDFTDCVIQCGGVEDVHDDDGDSDVHRLKAHRLVLGAVSPFLKLVFSEVPSSLAEATILVPGVKKRVVSALLDFLYTGEMTVQREDTAELQHLIETLQIDPELITVDVVRPEPEKERPKREKNEDNCSVTVEKVEDAKETEPEGENGRKRKHEDHSKDNSECSVKVKKVSDSDREGDDNAKK